MEAKTMTPEGAEFMRDILSGDEQTLVNYIKSVGTETACANIYKLAEYANDLTIQVEDFTDGSATIAELQDEIRNLKSKYTLHDFYKDEYHKAEKQVKNIKAIIKAMSAIVTEQ